MNVSVVRTPASLSFLRAYAIQDAMANPTGQIGYDQTTITKFQASCVTPESNAMTDSPAITSQKSNETTASYCETINQIRTGLREGVFTSKICDPVFLFFRTRKTNFTPIAVIQQYNENVHHRSPTITVTFYFCKHAEFYWDLSYTFIQGRRVFHGR